MPGAAGAGNVGSGRSGACLNGGGAV